MVENENGSIRMMDNERRSSTAWESLLCCPGFARQIRHRYYIYKRYLDVSAMLTDVFSVNYKFILVGLCFVSEDTFAITRVIRAWRLHRARQIQMDRPLCRLSHGPRNKCWPGSTVLWQDKSTGCNEKFTVNNTTVLIKVLLSQCHLYIQQRRSPNRNTTKPGDHGPLVRKDAVAYQPRHSNHPTMRPDRNAPGGT
jgi:hypothetical protein